MQLAEDQKDAVRKLIRSLGLSQAEFCRRVKWAPSAFSEVLRAGERSKGVSDSKWREILSTLKGLVAERGESLLDSGQLDSARLYLSRLWGKDASEEDVSQVQPPGGVILARAVNYVARPCDTLLMANLYRSEAPAIIVRGGIQFGKSSLLERFAAQAEKLGHLVAKADAHTLPNKIGSSDTITSSPIEGGKWKSAELFLHLFEELGIEGYSEMPQERPQEAARSAIEKWLQTATKNERVFLLIDSLDSLLDYVQPEAFEDLIGLFVWLRSQAFKALFDKLTLVAVFSGRGWSAAYASKFQSQAFELDVTPFRSDHISQLLRLLNVPNQNEGTAAEIERLFFGHPHLSHLAAFDLVAHGDWNLVLDIAGAVRGGYRTHWMRVKKQVDNFVQQCVKKKDQADVWEMLLNHKMGDSSVLPFGGILPSLAMMGILRWSSTGFEVPDFYKAAISMELGKPWIFRSAKADGAE